MGNKKLFRIGSWDQLRDNIYKKFHVDFSNIDDLYQEDSKWLTIDDYEEITSKEVLEKLQELEKFQGELTIVTDVSYSKKFGPFIVDEKNLTNFILEYFKNFNEPFLDEDVIIINFQKKIIWVLHHEGIYTVNRY